MLPGVKTESRGILSQKPPNPFPSKEKKTWPAAETAWPAGLGE